MSGTFLDPAPDVAVVGAGIIGLAAAFRLAGAGRRVAVLEAGRVGGGSTGAALGALMPHSPLKRTPLTDIQLASLAAMPDFIAEVERVSGLSCGYQRNGRLEILRSAEAGEQAEARIAAAATRWRGLSSAPPRRIDTAEARRLMPWIAPSDHGYLHDGATAQVRPAALVATLVAACRARQVEIVEGCAVQGVRATDSGVELHTGTGRVATGRAVAGHAVLCVGEAMAGLLGAEGSAFTGIKGETLHLPDLGDEAARPLVYGGGGFALSRPDGLLVGSTSDRTAPRDTTVTRDALKQLTGRCRQLLAVPEARWRPVLWSGVRPAVPDRQPVVGPLSATPRVVLAAGHFKIGLGLAPATADAVAAFVAGADPGVAWHDLGPARLGL